MKIFLPLFALMIFRVSASAQTQTDTISSFPQQDTIGKKLAIDTTQIVFADDTLSTPQHDSIVIVTPIPELGSIEPFGDTLTFITASEITWQEYRSLYDILSTQQGLFIRDLASPGQQNQIIAGGLTDRNIAVMVDGIPYDDYFTGGYNLWMIPVDAIERVEYISGAGSIFYDGKSAGATINIVTKNYNNNRAVTNLRYSQGVEGYVHTDAFFAQNVLRDLNLTLGLSHYGYGSNKESNNYRGRFRNSNDDAWSFRTKLRYNVNDWINLSFFYLYNKTWTGMHGGINYLNTASLFNGLDATVQNSDSYEKYSNSQYNFTAAFYPFPDSTLAATFSFYSFDRLREYRDEENRSDRNDIYKALDFPSFTNGVKFQLKMIAGFNSINYYTHYHQIKTKNEIVVGIKDEIQLHRVLSVTPFLTVISKSGDADINGGILSELSLTPSFKLFGGITESLVKDTPQSTASVHVPYSSAGHPESFSTKEIGIEFSIDQYFTSKVSFRQTEVIHPVIFDTIQISNSSLFIVKDKYSYNSISASAHFAFGELHLEGTGNYFQQPTLVRENMDLTLYPEITLDGSVYFHGLLADGNLDLKIGVRGRYFSKQTGMVPYDETGVWIPSSLLRYGPSGTMDFFAIGKIGSAYVHLIWENLPGNDYLMAPVYPMYERNIRFGLSWGFLD